ncbi:MAG: hypothetical protein JW966_13605 [Anaerolineae bacterium]|nr:hypothetical protein [Anaerolineae bacterium]
MNNTHNHPISPNDVLSAADQCLKGFRNKPEDLVLNRQGRLSPKQHTILKDQQGNKTLELIAVPIVGSAMALAGLFTMISQGISVLFVILLILGVVVIGVGVVLITRVMRRFQAEIDAGHVTHVEGIARLHTDTKNEMTSHIVRIADKRFEVTPDQFLGFRNGEAYAGYYTPDTLTLVSAEPVPLPPPLAGLRQHKNIGSSNI